MINNNQVSTCDPRCLPTSGCRPLDAEHVVGEGAAKGQVLHVGLGLELVRAHSAHYKAGAVESNGTFEMMR